MSCRENEESCRRSLRVLRDACFASSSGRGRHLRHDATQNPHGEEARKRRLWTKLRFARRTMRPGCNGFLRCLKIESERHHNRHCEEHRDEAIQTASAVRVWIASLALAMTAER